MEVISKYGVTLKPLTQDKIELVRQWRNHPKIQQFMEYREEITQEMQENWFKKISTSGTDYFYIIEYEGKDVGMINIKDVDLEKKTAEPGIFIWDDDYLETDVPVRATLARNDFAWDVLGLETLRSHVLSDNKRAIKYNKAFGFKLLPGQENIYNQTYILAKEDALRIRNKYIRILSKKQN